MPAMFPTPSTLLQAFSGCSAFAQSVPENPSQRAAKWNARHELYTAWSVGDEASRKATKLSDAAVAEFEKASSKAQAKVGGVELYSAKFYAACTVGGIMACGLTHTAVTPLDLVKCRRQVDSKMYKGNFEAWGKIGRAEGLRGIFTG